MSCAPLTKPLAVKAEAVKTDKPVFTRPAPIAVKQVQWRVITPGVMEDCIREGRLCVFYGLNEADYLAFADYFAELVRYLEESAALVKAWEQAQ